MPRPRRPSRSGGSGPPRDWRNELTPAAKRQLQDLDQSDKRRIQDALNLLAE